MRYQWLRWPIGAWPDDAPLLTIVIPTRNRLQILKESLDALMMNGGCDPRVEVIVIDNASTDGTAGYLRQVPMVRSHIQPEDVGTDRSLLDGIRLARGRYVKFLNDTTSVTDPRLISEHLRCIERNNPDAIVYVPEGPAATSSAHTMADALGLSGHWVAWLSSVCLRKDPDLGAGVETGTLLWQTEVLLEVFGRAKRVDVISGRMHEFLSQGPRGGYDVGEALLSTLFRALDRQVERGRIGRLDALVWRTKYALRYFLPYLVELNVTNRNGHSLYGTIPLAALLWWALPAVLLSPVWVLARMLKAGRCRT